MTILSGILLMIRIQFIGREFSLFVEWGFLRFNSIDFVFRALFDWIRLLFLSVVCLISGSVLSYCDYYIEGEKNYLRFTYIIISFVRSMWFLIISPNLVRILLGWDGLGLTSYALVIFYQNESSCNAGILTVLSNRVGDVAILVGITLIALSGGFNFYFLLKRRSFLRFCVILAAITKRAQTPFSAWLPAAMAAPTPVSSLVHSSTLVTAGVYLLIRFNKHVLDRGGAAPLLWVGVLTMLFSGVSANFEQDIKKVVALSTLSQLGLIFIVLSLGIWKIAFFHLVTHALFKSRLFMSVGFMIHSVKGNQDSRAIRRFGSRRPLLCLALRVTNLALCGFPFLAGFYSKDLILETIFGSYSDYFLLTLVVVRTGLTISYSLRLLYKGLSGVRVAEPVRRFRDFNGAVAKRVRRLVVLSCRGGYIVRHLYYPFRELCILGGTQKYWVLGVTLVNSLIIFLFINWQLEVKVSLKPFGEKFFSLIWYLTKLTTFRGSKPTLLEGLTAYRRGDRGWLEYYGGRGGNALLISLRMVSQKGQRSVIVRRYLLTILSGMLLAQIFLL